MHDVLRDTPIYQEILKEGRIEGKEEGLREGRTEGRIILRKHDIEKVIQMRFPQFTRLAAKQIAFINDVAVLEDTFFKLWQVQSPDEARAVLQSLDDYFVD